VREVGHIDLREALELTALTALHDRERGGRLALRWLRRWLDESQPRAVDEAAMVAALVASLGGDGHQEALLALRAMSESATGASPRRAVRDGLGRKRSSVRREFDRPWPTYSSMR
jgi:hypothetical protein